MGATEEEEGLAEFLGFRAGFLLTHRFPLGALWAVAKPEFQFRGGKIYYYTIYSP